MKLLTSELYRELRELAKNYMRGERKDHTLSGTDLFHEAYSRLHPSLPTLSNESGDLRALFAITMRRILLDHARKKTRRARLVARIAIPDNQLDRFSATTSEEDNAERLLELDEALQRFAEKYPIHAQVVELKYFGGMTVQQCADHLGICTATVQRYWNFARAWIGREMERIEQR
jgi:RNA polymerase sigma factor (TIGR02999 family)